MPVKITPKKISWLALSDGISLIYFSWLFWSFFFFSNQYLSRGIQFSRASLNGALTQHKNKDIKTRPLIKLQRQHVPLALLFKMALQLDCKFAEFLYLSDDSRQGVVGPNTVYSEATLVFSSFCKGRAQQIRASGVIAMEKVRVPKLCKHVRRRYYGLIGWASRVLILTLQP